MQATQFAGVSFADLFCLLVLLQSPELDCKLHSLQWSISHSADLFLNKKSIEWSISQPCVIVAAQYVHTYSMFILTVSSYLKYVHT